MASEQRWQLYGTLGCHLCEQAQVVVGQLQQEFDIQLTLKDIADETSLVESMGHVIPVLENSGTGEQLTWPFDPEKLTDWLMT